MTKELRLIGRPVLEGSSLYFAAGNFGGLFVTDIREWKVRWLCDISWMIDGCSADCYKAGSNIYCVSKKTMQIAVYNLTDGTLEMKTYTERRQEHAYTLLAEDKIWIFPRFFQDAFVCFDLKNDCFVESGEWRSWVDREKLEGQIFMAAQGEEIIMTLSRGYSIIRTQYPFRVFTKVELPVEEELMSVFYGGGRLYLTSKESYTLFSYDKKGDFTIEKFQIEEDGYFLRGFGIGDDLILTAGDRIYYISNKQLRKMEIPELSSADQAGSLFIHWAENVNQIYLLPWNSNCVVVMDKKKHVFASQKLYFASSRWLKNQLFMNEKDVDLRDFIEYIKLKEDHGGGRSRSLVNGQKIYQRLKEGSESESY